jgi:PAS domain S-box-containing protein
VQCTRASTAEQSRVLLQEQEFAAVLVDAQAIKVGNLETLQWMRGHPRYRETPVLFFGTSNGSGVDVLARADMGTIDYVALPVAPEILRSKIALFLDLHRARRDLRTAKAALDEARARLAVSEFALAERNAQLTAIFEHPTELTVLLEADRDGFGVVKDWVYRDANANALALIGLTREGVSGRRLSDLFTSIYEETSGHCEQVLRTRKRVRYETHYSGKDWRVSVCPGGERSVILSALEITDRKQAQYSLHENASVD